jgi:hypothetical protein
MKSFQSLSAFLRCGVNRGSHRHGARFYKTWLSDLPGHSHFTIEA